MAETRMPKGTFTTVMSTLFFNVVEKLPRTQASVKLPQSRPVGGA